MIQTEYPSEVSKYTHLIEKYCQGPGLDVGSQGSPCVPHAWQLDLPEKDFAWYNSNHPAKGPIQLRGRAENLSMIESGSLGWLMSSHLLEDFAEWTPVLKEWVRVIKPGGHLIILVPDKVLWNLAIANGQTPNCEHRHESHAGELSTYANDLGLEVIEDRLTDCFEGDYSVMFVARKK